MRAFRVWSLAQWKRVLNLLKASSLREKLGEQGSSYRMEASQ